MDFKRVPVESAETLSEERSKSAIAIARKCKRGVKSMKFEFNY